MARTIRSSHLPLLAVLAMGCGGEDDSVGPEPGRLGAVEIGAEEAVQIRSLLSITVVPSLGAALRQGCELAVADFGSIHGHAVDLGVAMDAMCSPEGGRAGARQIAGDPQVLGVIGTSCSAAAVAAVAGFAYGELGLRRMAALDDGDPYTSALVSAFAAAFRAIGGEVPITSTIDKGETDMTSVLVEFAEAAPDGIFFPLFEGEGTPFAEQARSFDGLEGATLITGAALFVSEFLGTPQSEGMYFAGPV